RGLLQVKSAVFHFAGIIDQKECARGADQVEDFVNTAGSIQRHVGSTGCRVNRIGSRIEADVGCSAILHRVKHTRSNGSIAGAEAACRIHTAKRSSRVPFAAEGITAGKRTGGEGCSGLSLRLSGAYYAGIFREK